MSDNEYDYGSDDSQELIRESEKSPNFPKRVLQILCAIFFSICILFGIFIISIISLYAMVEGGFIPWGSNFCEKNFTFSLHSTTPQQVFKNVRFYVNSTGAFEIRSFQEWSILNVTYTTTLWKFKDDIDMVFGTLDEGKMIINAKSKSRVGKWDFGGNNGNLERIVEGSGFRRMNEFLESRVSGCGEN